MEPQLEQRIVALEEKVDKILISVEKTRKYFKWTLIITVAAFVIPLILALFAVPSFIGSYTSQLNSINALSQ